MAAGKRVVTIEGLSHARSPRAQQAWIAPGCRSAAIASRAG